MCIYLVCVSIGVYVAEDLKIISTCKINHVKLKPKTSVFMNLSQLHANSVRITANSNSPAQYNDLRSEMIGLTFYVHNVALAAVVCRHNVLKSC